MTDERQANEGQSSRRDFLKTTVVAGTAFAVSSTLLSNAHAAGSEKVLKVGLIGCGNRGTGAAGDCVFSSPNVQLVAMADVFKDRLQSSLKELKKQEKKRIEEGKKNTKLAKQYNFPKKAGDHIAVKEEHCFDGLDAYERLLKCDVDLVIQATPPGFRPIHIPAIIEAGKHLFTEKPVAADSAGVQKILDAADAAKEKKLGVVAGTQRRHQPSYLEVMKRIKDGEVGDIVAARCYWNQGRLWDQPRKTGWSDLEWHIRNWLYFTYLSGDHICEQHVHNLDVVNWALDAHPIKAVGMGGREVRKDPKRFGNIFDHFAVDYEYPNGVHCMSMCRQIEGCAGNVSEVLVGTKGVSINADGHHVFKKGNKTTWRWTHGRGLPYVQEHTDLIASIRAGEPLNELKRIAESTMTAILGRMSAYIGKRVAYDKALKCQENLMPAKLSFEASISIPEVAVPGQTEIENLDLKD
jgi:predicted dehydrogenase